MNTCVFFELTGLFVHADPWYTHTLFLVFNGAQWTNKQSNEGFNIN